MSVVSLIMVKFVTSSFFLFSAAAHTATEFALKALKLIPNVFIFVRWLWTQTSPISVNIWITWLLQLTWNVWPQTRYGSNGTFPVMEHCSLVSDEIFLYRVTQPSNCPFPFFCRRWQVNVVLWRQICTPAVFLEKMLWLTCQSRSPVTNRGHQLLVTCASELRAR